MSSTGDQHRSKAEDRALDRRSVLIGGTTLAGAAAMGGAAPMQVAQAQAQPAPSGRPPNILVIFGDDIGQSNISAYTFGLMGYRTPSIDRIAREGVMFTDYYADQSMPKMFDLRADPSERADITSNTYYDWLLSQGYVIVAAQSVVGGSLASFKDFPPSQRAQSFSIDQIVEKMQQSSRPRNRDSGTCRPADTPAGAFFENSPAR